MSTCEPEQPDGFLVRLGRSVAAALHLVSRSELESRISDLRIYLEESVIMTAAAQYDEVITRLATRIGMLVAENKSVTESVKAKDEALVAAGAELASVQGELSDERASRTAEVAKQVGDALELDAQKDLARVQELLEAAGGEVPADVPDVPVPGPGEPADVPPGSDVDPIDESGLPDGPKVGDSSDSGDASGDDSANENA